MHSDRPPADLNPVQDKVVVLATYLGIAGTAMEWKASHTNSGATSENRGKPHGGDQARLPSRCVGHIALGRLAKPVQ